MGAGVTLRTVALQLAVRAGVALLAVLLEPAVRAGGAVRAVLLEPAVKSRVALRAVVFHPAVRAGGALRALAFHLAVRTRVALLALVFLPPVPAPLPFPCHHSQSVVACRAPRRVAYARRRSHSFEATFSSSEKLDGPRSFISQNS